MTLRSSNHMLLSTDAPDCPSIFLSSTFLLGLVLLSQKIRSNGLHLGSLLILFILSPIFVCIHQNSFMFYSFYLIIKVFLFVYFQYYFNHQKFLILSLCLRFLLAYFLFEEGLVSNDFLIHFHSG